MLRSIPVVLAAVVLGCAQPAATPQADAGVQAPDAGAQADAGPALEGWDLLQASLGNLETLAGTGLVRTDGVNNWTSSMEGGPALQAELSRPHFAMADAALNIFIVDKDAHAVRKVDASGTITTVAGTNTTAANTSDTAADARTVTLSSPNGLWVQPDGTFFILDSGFGKVRRVDVNGALTTLFTVPGGVSTGRGLWVSPDGSRVVLAAGDRVLQWTQAGGLTTLASGFSSLGNLVMTPNGRLAVTDRGANRVFLVSADGGKTLLAGNGSTTGGGDGMLGTQSALAGVRGVWPCLGGYLLATHEGSQVWFLDAAGTLHLLLDGESGAHAGDGEPFSSPGRKVSEPRAITMDAEGNILITDHDAGFIRRIRAAQR